ncbi:MAG: hypothetical protein RIQ56_736, partial [Candidatus Parcubacteria bacterium]
QIIAAADSGAANNQQPAAVSRRDALFGLLAIGGGALGASLFGSTPSSAQAPIVTRSAQIGEVAFIETGSFEAREFTPSQLPNFQNVEWGISLEAAKARGLEAVDSINPGKADFTISEVSTANKLSDCINVCNVIVGRGQRADGTEISFLSHSFPTMMSTRVPEQIQNRVAALLESRVRSLVDQAVPGTVVLTMWHGGNWDLISLSRSLALSDFGESVALARRIAANVNPTVTLQLPIGETIPQFNQPDNNATHVFYDTPNRKTTVISSKQMIDLMRGNLEKKPVLQRRGDLGSQNPCFGLGSNTSQFAAPGAIDPCNIANASNVVQENVAGQNVSAAPTVTSAPLTVTRLARLLPVGAVPPVQPTMTWAEFAQARELSYRDLRIAQEQFFGMAGIGLNPASSFMSTLEELGAKYPNETAQQLIRRAVDEIFESVISTNRAQKVDSSVVQARGSEISQLQFATLSPEQKALVDQMNANGLPIDSSKLDLAVYLRLGNINHGPLGEAIIYFLERYIAEGYSSNFSGIRIIPRYLDMMPNPALEKEGVAEIYRAEGEQFKIALEVGAVPLHLSHGSVANITGIPNIVSRAMVEDSHVARLGTDIISRLIDLESFASEQIAQTSLADVLSEIIRLEKSATEKLNEYKTKKTESLKSAQEGARSVSGETRFPRVSAFFKGLRNQANMPGPGLIVEFASALVRDLIDLARNKPVSPGASEVNRVLGLVANNFANFIPTAAEAKTAGTTLFDVRTELESILQSFASPEHVNRENLNTRIAELISQGVSTDLSASQAIAEILRNLVVEKSVVRVSIEKMARFAESRPQLIIKEADTVLDIVNILESKTDFTEAELDSLLAYVVRNGELADAGAISQRLRSILSYPAFEKYQKLLANQAAEFEQKLAGAKTFITFPAAFSDDGSLSAVAEDLLRVTRQTYPDADLKIYPAPRVIPNGIIELRNIPDENPESGSYKTLRAMAVSISDVLTRYRFIDSLSRAQRNDLIQNILDKHHPEAHGLRLADNMRVTNMLTILNGGFEPVRNDGLKNASAGFVAAFNAVYQRLQIMRGISSDTYERLSAQDKLRLSDEMILVAQLGARLLEERGSEGAILEEASIPSPIADLIPVEFLVPPSMTISEARKAKSLAEFMNAIAAEENISGVGSLAGEVVSLADRQIIKIREDLKLRTVAAEKGERYVVPVELSGEIAGLGRGVSNAVIALVNANMELALRAQDILATDVILDANTGSPLKQVVSRAPSSPSNIIRAVSSGAPFSHLGKTYNAPYEQLVPNVVQILELSSVTGKTNISFVVGAEGVQEVQPYGLRYIGRSEKKVALLAAILNEPEKVVTSQRGEVLTSRIPETGADASLLIQTKDGAIVIARSFNGRPIQWIQDVIPRADMRPGTALPIKGEGSPEESPSAKGGDFSTIPAGGSTREQSLSPNTTIIPNSDSLSTLSTGEGPALGAKIDVVVAQKRGVVQNGFSHSDPEIGSVDLRYGGAARPGNDPGYGLAYISRKAPETLPLLGALANGEVVAKFGDLAVIEADVGLGSEKLVGIIRLTFKNAHDPWLLDAFFFDRTSPATENLNDQILNVANGDVQLVQSVIANAELGPLTLFTGTAGTWGATHLLKLSSEEFGHEAALAYLPHILETAEVTPDVSSTNVVLKTPAFRVLVSKTATEVVPANAVLTAYARLPAEPAFVATTEVAPGLAPVGLLKLGAQLGYNLLQSGKPVATQTQPFRGAATDFQKTGVANEVDRNISPDIIATPKRYRTFAEAQRAYRDGTNIFIRSSGIDTFESAGGIFETVNMKQAEEELQELTASLQSKNVTVDEYVRRPSDPNAGAAEMRARVAYAFLNSTPGDETLLRSTFRDYSAWTSRAQRFVENFETGVTVQQALDSLNYTFWEGIPGMNLTVTRDALPNRYHIFINNGARAFRATLSFPVEDISLPASERRFELENKAVLGRVYERFFAFQDLKDPSDINAYQYPRIIEAYEAMLTLPSITSGSRPIAEMQLGEDGKLYALQLKPRPQGAAVSQSDLDKIRQEIATIQRLVEQGDETWTPVPAALGVPGHYNVELVASQKLWGAAEGDPTAAERVGTRIEGGTFENEMRNHIEVQVGTSDLAPSLTNGDHDNVGALIFPKASFVLIDTSNTALPEELYGALTYAHSEGIPARLEIVFDGRDAFVRVATRVQNSFSVGDPAQLVFTQPFEKGRINDYGRTTLRDSESGIVYHPLGDAADPQRTNSVKPEDKARFLENSRADGEAQFIVSALARPFLPNIARVVKIAGQPNTEFFSEETPIPSIPVYTEREGLDRAAADAFILRTVFRDIEHSVNDISRFWNALWYGDGRYSIYDLASGRKVFWGEEGEGDLIPRRLTESDASLAIAKENLMAMQQFYGSDAGGRYLRQVNDVVGRPLDQIFPERDLSDFSGPNIGDYDAGLEVFRAALLKKIANAIEAINRTQNGSQGEESSRPCVTSSISNPSQLAASAASDPCRTAYGNSLANLDAMARRAEQGVYGNAFGYVISAIQDLKAPVVQA